MDLSQRSEGKWTKLRAGVNGPNFHILFELDQHMQELEGATVAADL